jgi:hypothetical protein
MTEEVDLVDIRHYTHPELHHRPSGVATPREMH